MSAGNAWRIAGGAAIIAVAVMGINRVCLTPYECARALAPLQARTMQAAQASASDSGVVLARRNLERLDALPASCRDDLYWIMLVAANSRIVGDGQRAVAEYTRALARNQRPEIYYDRGMTLLEMHQPARAINDLAVAASFNPLLIEDLDFDTQRMVRDALATHRYNPGPF